MRLSSKQQRRSRVLKSLPLKRLLVGCIAVIGLASLFKGLLYEQAHRDPTFDVHLPPLVMRGGDPYIRALMRTISASEANDSQPYSILYGGQHVRDLSRHPERCVTILSGPNIGNCSTAAGRYQLLNITWYSIAGRYHPQPFHLLFWKSYSFEAEFQDKVVYTWLKDSQAWGVDISKLLRQRKLDRVLRELSSTWTSLGYGIENNTMTKQLPQVYEKVLQEELRAPG